jgi:hypothetical protein
MFIVQGKPREPAGMVKVVKAKDTEGIEGMAGIMSRADFVMLSIRLGALSSA